MAARGNARTTGCGGRCGDVRRCVDHTRRRYLSLTNPTKSTLPCHQPAWHIKCGADHWRSSSVAGHLCAWGAVLRSLRGIRPNSPIFLKLCRPKHLIIVSISPTRFIFKEISQSFSVMSLSNQSLTFYVLLGSISVLSEILVVSKTGL